MKPGNRQYNGIEMVPSHTKQFFALKDKRKDIRYIFACLSTYLSRKVFFILFILFFYSMKIVFLHVDFVVLEK